MNHAPRASQRGWVGLVVMMLALLIVAIVAKDALKQYGLMPGKPPETAKAGTPGERARAPGAMGIETLDVNSAPPSSGSGLDRARGVEDVVRQQAEERAARMENATK